MFISRGIDKDVTEITIVYYSEKKIMPLAATWMDLEIAILSEVSYTQTKII